MLCGKPFWFYPGALRRLQYFFGVKRRLIKSLYVIKR